MKIIKNKIVSLFLVYGSLVLNFGNCVIAQQRLSKELNEKQISYLISNDKVKKQGMGIVAKVGLTLGIIVLATYFVTITATVHQYFFSKIFFELNGIELDELLDIKYDVANKDKKNLAIMDKYEKLFNTKLFKILHSLILYDFHIKYFNDRTPNKLRFFNLIPLIGKGLSLPAYFIAENVDIFEEWVMGRGTILGEVINKQSI